MTGHWCAGVCNGLCVLCCWQVFTANGFLRRQWSAVFGTPVDQLSVFEHWIIGAMCGVLSATAICPPEVRPRTTRFFGFV